MKPDLPIHQQSTRPNHHTALVRHCIIMLWVVSWVMVFCGTELVSAQDDVGRKAFLKKNYPWYNAESDQVERIEMGDRPGVRSANRSAIPLKPIKNAPTTSRKWNWWNSGAFLGGLSVFAWALFSILVAAIAGILLWAFLRMESNLPIDDESNRGRSMRDSIQQLPFEIDSESGDFRQAARNGYLAGDYRKAIIYLFSHVLVSLDQKGHIRLRKGKTNRQYLRELRPYRPLANFYQRVMVPFEATFFGDHELEKQDFEVCWNQLEQFQEDMDQTTQVAHG